MVGGSLHGLAAGKGVDGIFLVTASCLIAALAAWNGWLPLLFVLWLGLLLAGVAGLSHAIGYALAVYVIVPPYAGLDVGGGLFVLNWQRLVMYSLTALIIGRLMLSTADRAKCGEAITGRRTRVAIACILAIGVLRLVAEARTGLGKGLFSLTNEAVYLYFLFVVVAVAGGTEAGRRPIAIGIMTAALGVAVFAILEYAFDTNPLASIQSVREDMVSASYRLTRFGHIRAEATLGQPIALGQVLVVGLGLVVSSWRRLLPRWVAAVLGATMLLAVLATGTRSTLIALVAAALLFGIRRPRILVWSSVLALAVYVQPVFLRDQMSGLVSAVVSVWQRVTGEAVVGATTADEVSSEISALGRLVQLQMSIPVVKGQPLLGVGMQNVRDATGMRTIDNYYLLTTLESGLPTAFMVSALLMTALWPRRRWGGGTMAAVERSGYQFGTAASAVLLIFVALRSPLPFVFACVALSIASLDDTTTSRSPPEGAPPSGPVGASHSS